MLITPSPKFFFGFGVLALGDYIFLGSDFSLGEGKLTIKVYGELVQLFSKWKEHFIL